MPDEPKTKTVRLDSELVNALKTIRYAESLQGKQFSEVTFLSGLVRRPINDRLKRAQEVIRKHFSEKQ